MSNGLFTGSPIFLSLNEAIAARKWCEREYGVPFSVTSDGHDYRVEPTNPDNEVS